MQDLNDKINGSELPPEEWNEVPSELQNLITSVGQSLSALDLQQVVKAVARYGTSGVFYEIDGTEVANTKNIVPFNDLVGVDAYTEGLVVIFNADVPNTTTTPQINLNGLGNRSCTRQYGANVALQSGDITGVSIFVYDGTRFALVNRKTVETDDIENNAITPSKIATSVAGDGLGGGNGAALFVRVDDSTIEINSDILRVKAQGIDTNELATDAVTNAKIADSAVDTAQIANSAVESAKINASAVTTAKINNGAVTSDKLGTNSVITSKILNANVTEAKLSVAVQNKLNAGAAAGSIGQTELDTSSGSINLSISTGTGGGFNGIQGTLPGGQYGFYPRNGGSAVISNGTGKAWGAFHQWGRDGNYNAAIPTAAYAGVSVNHASSGGGGASGSSSITGTATQRYMNASPPYNIGDGDVANWTFAIIDESTNEINGVYSANVPPWAYNGPTDVRPHRIEDIGGGVIKKYRTVPKNMPTPPWLGGDLAAWLAWQESPEMEEIEIDYSYKNADMNIFPHPFIANNLDGKQAILLEPCCSFTDNLNEMQNCQDVDTAALFMDGYIELGDEITDCCKPSNDIKVFKPKWKNTGA